MSKIDEYIKQKSMENHEWKEAFYEEYTALNASVLMTHLREGSGLNKIDFAKKVEKPRSTIDNIEKSLKNPSFALIEEIANKVGKRVEYRLVDIEKEEAQA